jgi:4-hydroxybenzoate polyprenyltransferase
MLTASSESWDARSANSSRRLEVDVDGPLIRSDLALETSLLLIRDHPLLLFMLPIWRLRGRHILWRELERRVRLPAEALPYNDEYVGWLREKQREGYVLWLRSTIGRASAEAIALHLRCFSGVMDVTGGAPKLASSANPVVERAVVVAAVQPMKARTPSIGTFARTLRVHQWAKNVLVLIPLLAAHEANDTFALINALLAVVAFCLCASAVYVMNDLFDLQADRAHIRKRHRPFASGDLRLTVGPWLFFALLWGSTTVALWLPWRFGAVLGAYFALTVAYSWNLKRRVMVDVMALAGLYTLRVIAGAEAIGVPLSFWLLLFSVFLFMSLALVKRYAELYAERESGLLDGRARGYCVGDLPLLESMGCASGFIAVMVLALYINSPAVEALYKHPKAIWLLCVLLLYWVARLWIVAHRGGMHDDPVVYAFKDRKSLALGVLAAATIAVAL